MEIGANKEFIALPEHTDAGSERLWIWSDGDWKKGNPGSCLIACQPIDIGDMERIREGGKERDLLRAMPAYFTVVQAGPVALLLLFPIPDKDYDAVFRYNPPAKEI